ncbi:MAG: alanine racemase [Myxococcales bacterium]|nr:alanine racemase [Myxococcales bacterium]
MAATSPSGVRSRSPLPAPIAEWQRFRRALEDEDLPAAVLDLDALEHNARVVLGALRPGQRLRIASKSIRVPAVLERLHALGRGQFVGLMTWSAFETRALAERGFDDLLLAYPIARPNEAAVLADLAAAGTTVAVVVDSVDQARLLGVAAAAKDTHVRVCLDVDVSLRPIGGRAHFGVRRSPIRDVETAIRVAEAVERQPGLRLVGLMAYEAQVAGIREHNPGSRHLDAIRRLIKRQSVPLAAARRAEIAAALEARGHHMEIVNGGGTGSLGSTPNDSTVTEVTAGSGFFCPHLFDHYEGLPLRPAAFFALAVSRRSDPDHITCFGGGYPASGPAGGDRLPQVHLPPGLEPLDLEGFGEVQTPFRVASDCPPLQLGDPIICRHAKAGELAERFARLLLLRGEVVEDHVATYRGLGWSFG